MIGLKLSPNDIEDRDLCEHAAVFSSCRKYRYVLSRRVAQRTSRRLVAAFVGLNPSTADAFRDDPTIRRCYGFAFDWGCSDFWMLNLFGYRATAPAAMKNQADPDGSHNSLYVRTYTETADIVVCCWGANVDNWLSTADLLLRARNVRGELRCLGRSSSGQPRHPLMLPRATQLESFALPRAV